jgi:hypothetical protein
VREKLFFMHLMMKLFYFHFRWNEVISSSKSTMNKIQLKLDKHEGVLWKSKISEFFTLNRKIVNIYVNLYEDEEALKLLIKFLESNERGVFVKNLSIHSAQLREFKLFGELLKLMPNLVSYKDTNSYFLNSIPTWNNNKAFAQITPIQLNHFKRLIFYHTSFEMLKYFQETSLSHFKLQRSRSFTPGDFSEHMDFWMNVNSSARCENSFVTDFRTNRRTPLKLRKHDYYLSHWCTIHRELEENSEFKSFSSIAKRFFRRNENRKDWSLASKQSSPSDTFQ